MQNRLKRPNKMHRVNRSTFQIKEVTGSANPPTAVRLGLMQNSAPNIYVETLSVLRELRERSALGLEKLNKNNLAFSSSV